MAVAQDHIDARIVLRKFAHVSPAIDRHIEFADPFRKDALDLALQQREPVRMACREIADIEPYPGEARALRHLALRQESIGDAALVEHLDGARMQAPGAQPDQILALTLLDD